MSFSPAYADVAILKGLLKDGRKSLWQISRESGISTPTVKARFDRLVNIGFIKSVSPILDSKKVDYSDNSQTMRDFFVVPQLASSTEIKSEHPIPKAIVNRAKEQSIAILDVSEFNSISGYGVVSSHLEKRIFVGSPNRSSGNNGTTIPQKMQPKITELESQGKTVVAIYAEDKLAGFLQV